MPAETSGLVLALWGMCLKNIALLAVLFLFLSLFIYLFLFFFLIVNDYMDQSRIFCAKIRILFRSHCIIQHSLMLYYVALAVFLSVLCSSLLSTTCHSVIGFLTFDKIGPVFERGLSCIVVCYQRSSLSSVTICKFAGESLASFASGEFEC